MDGLGIDAAIMRGSNARLTRPKKSFTWARTSAGSEKTTIAKAILHGRRLNR